MEAQERTRGDMEGIKKGETVFVDMTDYDGISEYHESGYAEVLGSVKDVYDTLFYIVRFRGSDDTQTCVHHRRVTPVEDTQEDTMHDKHYRDSIVEPILVMQDFFSHDELIGFLKGNILKYRLRAGHKGTKEEMQADLDKIRVYEKWLDAVKNGERIEL